MGIISYITGGLRKILPTEDEAVNIDKQIEDKVSQVQAAVQEQMDALHKRVIDLQNELNKVKSKQNPNEKDPFAGSE